jgi:hypothetical protein
MVMKSYQRSFFIIRTVVAADLGSLPVIGALRQLSVRRSQGRRNEPQPIGQENGLRPGRLLMILTIADNVFRVCPEITSEFLNT